MFFTESFYSTAAILVVLLYLPILVRIVVKEVIYFIVTLIPQRLIILIRVQLESPLRCVNYLFFNGKRCLSNIVIERIELAV